MKLLPIPFGVLLGICLISLLGCHSDTTTASNPLDEIARYVEQEQGRRVFQYSVDGIAQEKETQWSRIQPGAEPEQYVYTEVYNVYQAEDQSKEYYVQEFSFDGTDKETRFKVRDFQFIASVDSFSLTTSKEYEFQVAGKQVYGEEGKEFGVYQFLGYAHIGDPEPSHHKYWSPDIGTVLIWYGEKRFFELIEPQYPFLQQIKTQILFSNP